MNQRVFRANAKSPAERLKERELRERLQQEKPSLDDLVQSGECDSGSIMTMGMYHDASSALQALKRERQRAGLSLGDVAERSGLDRAVVSRLENGKQENPTIATLMRYAAGVGKRFLWTYEDLTAPKKPARRRSKAS